MFDIELLNRRFGAPGRIVFKPGHCGYPNVILANRYGSAEVALLGGNVLSYRPTGCGEVIFRPKKSSFNRGEAFHGGVPICWPQFGGLAIEGMAKHGFARLMPFAVIKSSYSEEMTEVTFALESSPDTQALWPHEFRLEFTVTLSMKLNLKLVTRNTGKTPFAFSAAFHPYLLVRDVGQARVRGLDGCHYVYATDMSEHDQQGDLALTEPLDHVFTLPAGLRHELALLDDGLKRAIAVASAGNGCAVAWYPASAQGFADLEESDCRRFCCVEPVTSWPKTGEPLAPGEERELFVAIQAVLDGIEAQ